MIGTKWKVRVQAVIIALLVTVLAFMNSLRAFALGAAVDATPSAPRASVSDTLLTSGDAAEVSVTQLFGDAEYSDAKISVELGRNLMPTGDVSLFVDGKDTPVESLGEFASWEHGASFSIYKSKLGDIANKDVALNFGITAGAVNELSTGSVYAISDVARNGYASYSKESNHVFVTVVPNTDDTEQIAVAPEQKEDENGGFLSLITSFLTSRFSAPKAIDSADSVSTDDATVTEAVEGANGLALLSANGAETSTNSEEEKQALDSLLENVKSGTFSDGSTISVDLRNSNIFNMDVAWGDDGGESEARSLGVPAFELPEGWELIAEGEPTVTQNSAYNKTNNTMDETIRYRYPFKFRYTYTPDAEVPEIEEYKAELDEAPYDIPTDGTEDIETAHIAFQKGTVHVSAQYNPEEETDPIKSEMSNPIAISDDGEELIPYGAPYVDYEIVKGYALTAEIAGTPDGYIFKGWHRRLADRTVGELITTNEKLTYKPGITSVNGSEEPLRDIIAVFEEIEQPEPITFETGEYRLVYTASRSSKYATLSTDVSVSPNRKLHTGEEVAYTVGVSASPTELQVGKVKVDVSKSVNLDKLENLRVAVNGEDASISADGIIDTGAELKTENDRIEVIISGKVPNDKSLVGQPVSVVASASADERVTPSSDASATAVVEQPAMAPMLVLDDAKPSAGDTITFVASGVSHEGDSHGVVLSVELAGLTDACIVEYSDGGQFKDGIVSWNIGDVADGESFDNRWVSVKLPVNTELNGKDISAKGTVSGVNIDDAALPVCTAQVQTPVIGLVKVAKAISSNPSVDGKIADSEGNAVENDTVPTDVKTVDDALVTDADDEGGSEVAPIAEPDVKPEGNLVINAGDSIHYEVTVSQAAPDAAARRIAVVDGLSYNAIKNGTRIVDGTLSINANGKTLVEGEDYTLNWIYADEVTLDDEGNEITPPARPDNDEDRQKVGFAVFSANTVLDGVSQMIVEYDVLSGDSRNDMLRGAEIKNSAIVMGGNFDMVGAASVTVSIASATLTPALTTDKDVVSIGDRVTYDLVVRNTDTNRSSIAKNVFISSAFDSYSANLGYLIDKSTLKVLSVENGVATDITDSCVIDWPNDYSFRIETGRNLRVSTMETGKLEGTENKTEEEKYAGIDHAIVVTYVGTAESISAKTHDNTMVNSVLVRADNATYAAANKAVLLNGADSEAPQAKSNTVSGRVAGKGGISDTGDVAVEALAIGGGIVAVALIGLVVWRKNRG